MATSILYKNKKKLVDKIKLYLKSSTPKSPKRGLLEMSLANRLILKPLLGVWGR